MINKLLTLKIDDLEIIGQTRIGSLHLPDGKIIKFAVNGLNRNGYVCDNPYLDEHMFKSYEETECKQRYLKVKSGDIFLDIGACIGSWSIHAAIYGAKVYAFDVFEPGIKTILLNSRLNNVQDMISVHKVALRSNDVTDLAFTGYMKVASLRANWPPSMKPIPIKSITLDEWTEQFKNELPHIDFIKIDVEGMEFEVLKGAVKTLQEYRPKLSIEIHDQEHVKMRERVEKILKDLGYNHEHIPGLNDYFYH